MSTVTDETSLFLLGRTVTYTAQNASSYGAQDFSGVFTSGSSFVTVAQIVGYNSVAPLTTGFQTYFKVQGYNPLTNTYETWHCRGTPLLLPPSGHNLLNVSVIASWIDR